LVSATVLKLLVRRDTSGKTLEYQDFRKLAYKIAHDVVVDGLRAISRATWRAKPLDLEPQPEAAPAKQAADDQQQQDAMIRAVQALDHADHQLVIMRLHGATWEQVAASLRITDEAARKRWQRLLEKFRRQLSDG
jgi:RNA polymerase sigma factor (sigma-70 family)